MAGRGPAPAPKANRRRKNEPARGDWRPAPGSGWQHGSVPPPPDGLTARGLQEWQRWFSSWWAANWTPEYLGSIEIAIILFDSVVGRRDVRNADQMRIAMDAIGCTFKGQQDRRWVAPVKVQAERPAPTEAKKPGGQYGHLRAVGAAG